MDIGSSLSFGGILLWLAHVCYVGCFIPQVVTNYRLKSTEGLSPITIFIYCFGYSIEILYVYFLDLPGAFKVMIPLGALVAYIIVAQRFYYTRRKNERLTLFLTYSAMSLVILALALRGIRYPKVIGNLTGWLGSLSWLVYQMPQIYKIYTQKHTKGFNPFFAVISGVGALLEVTGGILCGVPIQTIFNGCRGAFMASVFIGQFLYYKK